MKIQKIAFRNKWETLANKITRDMISYIKENYNKFKVGARIVKNTNYNGIDMSFIIETLSEQEEWSVSVNGGLDEKSKIIYVFIKINLNHFSRSHFTLFSNKINKSVWHELEHIGYIQNLKNEKLDKGYDSKTMIESVDPIDVFNEKVKYLSQQYEKIAFVKSLKGNAVRNKTSLINDIRTFIHEQLYLNDSELEKLIKQYIGERATEIEQNLVSQYINYALETYPNIINYKLMPNSLK